MCIWYKYNPSVHRKQCTMVCQQNNKHRWFWADINEGKNARLMSQQANGGSWPMFMVIHWLFRMIPTGIDSTSFNSIWSMWSIWSMCSICSIWLYYIFINSSLIPGQGFQAIKEIVLFQKGMSGNPSIQNTGGIWKATKPRKKWWVFWPFLALVEGETAYDLWDCQNTRKYDGHQKFKWSIYIYIYLNREKICALGLFRPISTWDNWIKIRNSLSSNM